MHLKLATVAAISMLVSTGRLRPGRKPHLTRANGRPQN